MRKFNLRTFFSLTVPWLLLWLLPWTDWLDGLPWLRLGLAGIIFITPGVSISLLLTGKRFTLQSHITGGLALSIFLFGLLGVVGKIAHLPFEFIKSIFFVVGLVVFLLLTIHVRSTPQLIKRISYSRLSTTILLFMIVFGSVIAFMSRFEVDDFTYLSYLTNWQHSPRLGFAEPVFGSGALELSRYWTAMLPMNLALLAEISNLHGLLLLGFYLGPVLVAISFLAIYNLYEDLLQSRHQAVIALLFQFAVLFLLLDRRQPGNIFFLRITEDKSFAAFILAPVFFQGVNCFLESPTIRRGVFILLSGWSLALTHPIILAYGVFIAGLHAVITTGSHKKFKTLGILISLLLLVILPSSLLRFPSLYGREVQAHFDLESTLDRPGDPRPVDRISYIEWTPFYGFNLDFYKIQTDAGVSPPWISFILSWTYMWLLGFGFLWSFVKLTKRNDENNVIASFIMASSLLVVLCAIPYTGWLVGYFVSSRMLWRAPWLFPIGLVGVILMMDIIKMMFSKVLITSRRQARVRSATFVSFFVIFMAVVGFSISLQHGTIRGSFDGLHEYKITLEERAALGDYIETQIEEPSIFLASWEMMDYLPGLSSKAKVVFFRTSSYTPHPVNRGDVNDVFSINAEGFPINRRMKVFDRYRVQYLLIEDSSVYEYYAEYPQFFKWEKFGNYWLIEYTGMAEDQ
jgi:hypothetical protein